MYNDGVNGPSVKAIGSGAGADAVRDTYNKRVDFKDYKKRYAKELSWMGISAEAPAKKEEAKTP